MSPKVTTAFRLDADLLEAMRQVKDRDGVPVTTQVEMAVRAWLTKRGVHVTSARKRPATRKRE
jgi:hypothetical protein